MKRLIKVNELKDAGHENVFEKSKPMQKVAKMLCNHQVLVPRGFSSGPVAALNNKAKLTIKKAYGFKSTLSPTWKT
jgi:transposase